MTPKQKYDERKRLRTEAEDIARSIRDETTDICIRAIESLYIDSQGLILDVDTLDACTSMLRSLKAAMKVG